MSTYDLVGDISDVVAPALIVSFEDWVDAGSAGSTAARHLASGGEVVARFDSDAIYDYRSHRPILDIVEGTPKSFVWPEMSLTRKRYEERDLFVLTGPEPDDQWRQFAGDVLELSLRIGIVAHVSLGAIPAAVPHTAPTPVMMTASSDELKRDAVSAPGLLRVPAAAVSLIEWTLAENGIPAVGFWAQVPHYATPYAPGAVALLRKVEGYLQMRIEAEELEAADAQQRKSLQETFEGNPEAQEYLERLEQLIGEDLIPGTEDIAEEVERFLRNNQRGEGGGPNPFSP